MLATIFMIRNGEMGSNYDFKLIGSLIGVALVVYYLIRFGRKDALWVYLTGFFIWFVVEWFLQAMGIRAIKDASLFGHALPGVAQALLRGGFEGALVATLGIVFADGLRLPGRRRMIFSAIFAVVLAWIAWNSLHKGLPAKDVGGDVLSRRDMLNPTGLIALLLATGYTLWYYFKKAGTATRKRILYMYLVMVSIGLIWNIAEFTANTRWIEAGTFENPVRATPIVELLALGWDTFIEIAMAYVPFLIIPLHLGLIHEK